MMGLKKETANYKRKTHGKKERKKERKKSIEHVQKSNK